ncbi:MAG: imidazole glycerol phosphate synthase subunit HisH [Phycisphaerales bacterium JB065]
MSDARTVTIIRTGIANTASLAAAFGRLGLRSTISDDPKEIERSELLVLPGVGSFGSGAARIADMGIRGILRDRVGSERPLLAVCLGMQLLCESSEESPGARGLGIIGATIRRFPSDAKVPQMGWNEVEARTSGLVESGTAYFANSYRLTDNPTGWISSFTDYAGRYVSAMELNRTLACQFHPELSGTWGMRLLGKWAGAAADRSPSAAKPETQAC